MTPAKKKLYIWGVVCLAVILAAQCILTISIWSDVFEAQRFLIQCSSPQRKTEIEERISQLQAQKQEVKDNLSQIQTRNRELQSKIDDERYKNKELSNALEKAENRYSQNKEIETMMDKSSVGGKYSELLQVMEVPGDKEEYGSFEDYGHWGGEYEGYDGKEGYWVYNAPFWFVWDKKKETSTNWASAPDDDQKKEDAQQEGGASTELPKTPAYQCAVIDNEGYVDPEATVVNRYEYLLGELEERYRDSSRAISDRAVQAQEVLRDKYGKEVTILTILETAENMPKADVEHIAKRYNTKDKADVLFTVIILRYK